MALMFDKKSYIDKQQNIWFIEKDVSTILGYSDTDQSIKKTC